MLANWVTGRAVHSSLNQPLDVGCINGIENLEQLEGIAFAFPCVQLVCIS